MREGSEEEKMNSRTKHTVAEWERRNFTTKALLVPPGNRGKGGGENEATTLPRGVESALALNSPPPDLR